MKSRCQRCDALAVGVCGLRHRVPHVDVLELRPETEVRVRDVEHAVRGAHGEPRVVGPELDAVAVQPNDELLAGADAQRLAVACESGLGLGDEAYRPAPRSRSRPTASPTSIGERDDAVAVGRRARRRSAAATSSSSGADAAKWRRLERFERTRSWSVYVARTPRFSRALATWLIRAAKRVFVLCTAGPYATPRDRADPAPGAPSVFVLYPRLGAA